jgi:glycine cleavage system aminomethyltransferase T
MMTNHLNIIPKQTSKARRLIRESEARADRGLFIYKHDLKKILEPKYNGKIVCIEYESKDYFIGKDEMKALEKARKKYPDKLFFFAKVGDVAIHTLNRSLV